MALICEKIHNAPEKTFAGAVPQDGSAGSFFPEGGQEEDQDGIEFQTADQHFK